MNAQSLSSSFAVTGTSIEAAPTWEGGGQDTNDGEAAGRGLMLRIEGLELGKDEKKGLSPSSGEKGKGKEAQEVEATKGLEQLMEEYETGMKELCRVVEANEKMSMQA